MRWIIGLDTRPSSHGAIELAGWLASTKTGDDFHGVHVLEHDELMAVLRSHHLSEIVEKAEAAVAEAVAGAPSLGGSCSCEVVQGMSAEKTLVDAVARHGADGLIIGRQAKRHDNPVVSLGRVARRLLRHLPVATIVTPPDLEPQHLGDGPVVCAITDGPESAAAIVAARTLAEHIGRPLHLLHVVAPPQVLQYFRSESQTYEELSEWMRDEARARVAQWLKAQGHADLPLHTEVGGVTATVLYQARHLKAPLVVCGSRRLNTFERVFSSSIGMELAALLPMPVMVVPPQT